MKNERITESFVRDHFKADPLAKVINLEEQRSSSRRIGESLRESSKSGALGRGYPEFIVSFPIQNSNYIIIVECKYDVSKHESTKLDKPRDYAVDGTLHYAKALSVDFDVIALAVSGADNTELRVSTFRIAKGSKKAVDLEITSLRSINDYLKLFNNEGFSDSLKNIDIVQKAVFLNEEFHSYSITETARCTMVSGFLVGLLDNPFKIGYPAYENSANLAEALVDAINRVLKGKKVRNWESMHGEFKKITNEPLFRQEEMRKGKENVRTILVVKDFINYIHKNVYPLISMDDAGMDVLGKFYTEFIRYAGSSQAQGLVLTPFHVAELFCTLAGVNEESVVYDPVCGSAGFLIAAMKAMLPLAEGDSEKKDHIKERQLIGVERRADMYTYACTNMMFRGDGKSNIYNNDCFIVEADIIKEHQPNVVLLNPPYDKGNAEQMAFVEHGLRVVGPRRGVVVAIVQMSCALKNETELKQVKKRLLSKHSLRAVISMPDDLFSPVPVNTCAMVWEANKPNGDNETWFGYLKDDGFEKRKRKGRVDIRKRWLPIRTALVRAYTNSREIPGLSVKHNVSVEDEWCAEAFMKTDYTKLVREDFERVVQDHIAFRVSSEVIDVISTAVGECVSGLSVEEWRTFRYDQIFEIKNGYYNRKPMVTEEGIIPFIGATESNNGVTGLYSLYDIETQNKDEKSNEHGLGSKLYSGNQITVSNNGSVGFAFYQRQQFTCTHDVNVLSLRGFVLNPYLAMFLCTLIHLERFRWTFGRKWRPKRMPSSEIRLPTLPDGMPDWDLMERYIKSLPYSGALG